MATLATLHVFRRISLNRFVKPLTIFIPRHFHNNNNQHQLFNNNKNLINKMSYTTIERGAPNTTDFRIFFSKH